MTIEAKPAPDAGEDLIAELEPYQRERIKKRQHAVEVLKDFTRLFAGNPHAYIVRYEDGRYETVQRNADGSWEMRVKDKSNGQIAKRTPRSDPWPRLWEGHLRGEYPSLLSIPILPTGNVYWGAIDIDRHDDSLPPLDHAALAREITRLQLPLLVWQSKNEKGGYCGFFFHDQQGCPASIVRRVLAHYRDVLRLQSAEEIFPKQVGPDPKAGTDDQRVGNGINLPYFGEARPAFGAQGEVLSVEGFLELAKRRRISALGLSNEVRGWPDIEGTVLPEQKEAHPLPIEAIRRIGEQWIEKLRHAVPGDRHHKLVAATFYFATAFAANALVETEAQIREKLWGAYSEAWSHSREPWTDRRKRLDEGSMDDAWDAGLQRPQQIVDPVQEASEALDYVNEKLASQWDLGAEEQEQLLQHVRKMDRLELAKLRLAIAKKLKIGVRDLNNILKEASQREKDSERQEASGAILYSLANYHECLYAAEAVLAQIPGRYYECNRTLVMPIHAREIPKEEQTVERDGASVLIQPASKTTVRRDLIEHASFVEIVKGAPEPIFPPDDIREDIFDRVRTATADVPYRHLEMLVATPCLLPSGTVHDAPGDLREGVLFRAPACEYPRVPDKPTQEDAIEAMKKFERIFCKFPFVGTNENEQPLPWNATPSYSVVLAGGLSLVARPALRGPDAVPVFVSNGPKQRSGKTLIVEAITIAALGHNPTPLHYADEEELGKTLLPIVQQQDRAVLIDNVERSLRSAKLAMLVTGNRLRDRILGESTTVDLYNRSVFFATGNNLQLAGDLASRAVQSRIVPVTERPEERSFDFDPREVARKHHPELVIALLTALRAYVLAGKPWQPKNNRQPWGGFTAWDQLVSGCLVWLGFADPVATRADVISDDPERVGNINLLEALFTQFGNRPFLVAQIEKNPATELYKMLLKDGKWSSEHVAWRLTRIRDRVEGGLQLVRPSSSKSSSKRLWQVLQLEPREKGVDDGNLPF